MRSFFAAKHQKASDGAHAFTKAQRSDDVLGLELLTMMMEAEARNTIDQQSSTTTTTTTDHSLPHAVHDASQRAGTSANAQLNEHAHASYSSHDRVYTDDEACKSNLPDACADDQQPQACEQTDMHRSRDTPDWPQVYGQQKETCGPSRLNKKQHMRSGVQEADMNLPEAYNNRNRIQLRPRFLPSEARCVSMQEDFQSEGFVGFNVIDRSPHTPVDHTRSTM